MQSWSESVIELLEAKDYKGLDQLLAAHPDRVNQGIGIPFDPKCRILAHPLHRICDAVFTEKIADLEAIEPALIFLDRGADIDGYETIGEGTPLMAAASLHAEALGNYYIEKGAKVNPIHPKSGESALHWASYCGMDKLVERLIASGAILDEPDHVHKSTPLGWAIHALRTQVGKPGQNQGECVELLLDAGADSSKLDGEQYGFLIELAKGNGV